MKLLIQDPLHKSSPDSVERILSAAAELFAEHGFDAVSINDIAARAGVSKSNIFHHFSSKNDLYLAVLHEAREAFFELIDDLHASEGELADRLGTFARAHLSRMLQLGKISRLVLRDLLENSPERNKQLAEKIFGKNFSLLVEIMRDSQRRGNIRPGIDPAMAVAVLLAADVFFFLARDILQHFPDASFAEDQARYSELLVDILLHGILPRPEPGKGAPLSSSNIPQG